MDQPKIGLDLSSLFQKHKYKINFQLRMKKKKIQTKNFENIFLSVKFWTKSMISVSTNSEVLFHVLEDFVDVSVGVNLSNEILKNRRKVELGPKLKRWLGQFLFPFFELAQRLIIFFLETVDQAILSWLSPFISHHLMPEVRKKYGCRGSRTQVSTTSQHCTTQRPLVHDWGSYIVSNGLGSRCIFYRLIKPKEKLITGEGHSQ